MFFHALTFGRSRGSCLNTRPFQCNVMHANQCPVYAFSCKSHVQTAHESHDLNMDFAASNTPMQEYLFNIISKHDPNKHTLRT